MPEQAQWSPYWKALDAMNAEADPSLARWAGRSGRWLDRLSRTAVGQAFSAMEPRAQVEFLARYQNSPLAGQLLRALSAPTKLAWLARDEVHEALIGRGPITPPEAVEPERWHQQVSAPADCGDDETLEADVVVVGSGAGGAAAAYELAAKGLAVLILEEGAYYDRRDFNGRIPEMIQKLYRNAGVTGAVGNSFIPIPLGRSVGGTTTINSGTCLRTPDTVLRQWQAEGLVDLTTEQLEPYFAEVEAMLQVTPAEPRHIGEIANVIATGARANGFAQVHPLTRNAPGCDGQGLCQFGCPTGAKQSTNVSFIPRALDRGAFLMTGYRAERLIWDGERVQGLEARSVDGNLKHLRVTAGRVVLAMGSLITPHFLQQNGVRLPMLGRNLSIHPAGAVYAHFPERRFDNASMIPQGLGVTDLAEEGIVFEGATPPPLAYGMMLPQLGEPFMEKIRQYQQMAFFGFMIRDRSRGRVRAVPGFNQPLVTYRMQGDDFRRFRKATEWLARMYLSAGAEAVYLPGRHGDEPIRNEKELTQILGRCRSARDFLVTAYHPLGTARLGVSSRTAVCDPCHRVFGTRNLYVMDGSCVPSALGANPQVTIMSLAMRGARMLAETI
ncbi:GMC family oxidoreductase [Marinobacteraceae bacterium S3BR75-40.1]